ncbi:MAG: hypothetical protein ACI4JN_11825 [Ruminococcus sp.]
MDNDILKLEQAKMYMDYLANGVDPVSKPNSYYAAKRGLPKSKRLKFKLLSTSL